MRMNHLVFTVQQIAENNALIHSKREETLKNLSGYTQLTSPRPQVINVLQNGKVFLICELISLTLNIQLRIVNALV